jgi:enoyl-CoA hydratase/carnithine racemase
VAPAVALEILLEGKVFDASEALSKGLVNRMVAPGDVESETLATAERIAQGAPLVNRWHKKFIWRVASGEAISAEDETEGFACFDTEDYKSGVAAFLAKTKPNFEGH